VDRQTRKDLKTDKFAAEVFDVFEWSTQHKDKVVRYGALAVAVLVVIFGGYFYMDYQASMRQKALADALHTMEASIGPDATAPGGLHFTSQTEKDTAISKAYNELATKYSGTGEGSVAAMSLGSEAAGKGNFGEAEKHYKGVVDNGPKPYAALARLALAQVYQSEGKTADAQKLLQDAVNNPTETVSKEQATIALARVTAAGNKADALKTLDKLRVSQRVAISGAAGQAYSEIDNAGKK
jgi:predicted negative regulator of RcsB-dependent stress response